MNKPFMKLESNQIKELGKLSQYVWYSLTFGRFRIDGKRSCSTRLFYFLIYSLFRIFTATTSLIILALLFFLLWPRTIPFPLLNLFFHHRNCKNASKHPRCKMRFNGGKNLEGKPINNSGRSLPLNLKEGREGSLYLWRIFLLKLKLYKTLLNA